MITGRVYVELIEGQWQTMPAALISLDEQTEGRVIVMVFVIVVTVQDLKCHFSLVVLL